MVIFGGLEFIVGGYVLHRYHKNKSAKKKLENEAHQRRHNTFPRTKHQCRPQQYPQHMPHQKYSSYYTPQQQQQPQPPQLQLQPQTQPQPQPQYNQPRPYTAQTFPQAGPYAPPTHAQPIPQFHQLIQPLQRSDSFSTLSDVPVANGSQYSDVYPPLPPRPQPSNTLAIPQQPVNSPYNHSGFSMSVPSFHPSPTTPTSHGSSQLVPRHTVDDNWETYSPHSPHVRFAVSGAPQPGERDDEADPPPPYRP